LASRISGSSPIVGFLYLAMIVFFIKAVLVTAHAAIVPLFVGRLFEDWSLSAMRNYLYGPYSAIIRERRGSIIQKVSGDPLKAAKGIDQLVALLTQALFAIVMIATLLLVNWQVMLGLTALMLLTVLLLQAVFGRPMYRLGKQQLTAKQALTAVTSELVTNVEVIKLLGVQNSFVMRLIGPIRKIVRTNIYMGVIRKAPGNFIEFVIVLCVALMFLILSTWFGMSFEKAAPIIGTFAVISARLMTSLTNLLSRRLRLVSIIPAIVQVRDHVKGDAVYTSKNKGSRLKRIAGDIVLSGVGFGYSPKQTVLNDVSLKIPKGKFVALVGPSGSGKSTLSYLLTRLFETDEGSILINGRDIKEFSVSSLRSRIGYVEQTPRIFNGTIEENIRLGNLKARNGSIVTAAKAAGLHDFIVTLPDGYQTKIKDQGATLSGGQAQRISFARAFVRSPDLLIIDEGTSALDRKSEAVIHQSIGKLRKGTSVLFITHRTGTLEDADLIYEMKPGGRVVLRTFEEVA
ncbi:MAG: ABC transporter ATP-binding protein, partial [Methyloligellaceae bacterium]